MFDCQHRRTMMIQSSRGMGDSEHVSLCADCGEFRIFAEQEGVRFKTTFHLWSNSSLIAASQAIAHSDLSPEEKRTRVWKPLDFAHLRLYKVVLSWQYKDGEHSKETYIVAADAPNQGSNSAAHLIQRIYQDTYDNNPMISYWDVHGYPLDVLQPREWKENGVQYLNNELVSAVRRYLMADEDEERLSARRAMAELVSSEEATHAKDRNPRD